MNDSQIFIINDYLGFGDNIYKRPFIMDAARKHKHLYVYTAFPELLMDVPNISFCKPNTKLKTQALNISHIPHSFWVTPKDSYNSLRFNYNSGFRYNFNVIQTFEQIIPISKNWSFQMPIQPDWIIKAKNQLNKHNIKKFVIIRPPTTRTEWSCEARNCKTEYLNQVIKKIPHYYSKIAIGDCGANEQLDSGFDLKQMDYNWLNGELDIWTTVGLVALSGGVISSVCFMLPLCPAIKVPLFCIWGGHIKPELLVDARMGLEKTKIISPINPCNCIKNDHKCEKTIDVKYLETEFLEWSKNLL